MKRFLSVPFAIALVACMSALPMHAASAASDVTDPDAPRALPADGPVRVQWSDPAQFADIRQSRNRSEARRGDWVREIAKYVQQRAALKLPPGQTLDVTITDIKRAGDYEPWHGAMSDSTRFVRDIYPPRIVLTFRQTDAEGRRVAEGERRLTDLTFLRMGSSLSSTDTLRYEKRLVDDWLRKEFRDQRAAAR